MLAKSPGKRPSIAEIYKSKWLSEINDLGPVPFPLVLDEPDSASAAPAVVVGNGGSGGQDRLSASLGATSAASPPSPTLAAEMRVCH